MSSFLKGRLFFHFVVFLIENACRLMTYIRKADPSELEWINSRYDEVHFLHSIFDKEVIAIAEEQGIKKGLGRIVTIDTEHLELGGIYVFEKFRNQGIARIIVDFLLKQATANQIVYCIAFVHLVPFYKQFGFTSPCLNTPKKIQDKYEWCKKNYPTPTELLAVQVTV